MQVVGGVGTLTPCTTQRKTGTAPVSPAFGLEPTVEGPLEALGGGSPVDRLRYTRRGIPLVKTSASLPSLALTPFGVRCGEGGSKGEE